MDALGIRVVLRDVQTLDEWGDVHAPAPVEPGDLVAYAEHVSVIEVVLAPITGGRRVEPVLVRRRRDRPGVVPVRGADDRRGGP